MTVQPAWRIGSPARRLFPLTAGLIAVAAARPGPITAAALGLVLLVLAVLLTPRAPDEVDVAVRSSTDRLTVGDVVRLDVEVESDHPLHGAVAILPAPGVEVAGRSPWMPLPADGRIAVELRPRGWMSGVPGHAQLTLSTPHGGRVGTTSIELAHLIAHPRPDLRPTVYAPPHLLSRLGTHTGRKKGAGTEFAELREYVSGDALRDIDWKSSARTGQLMVSQRYQDQAADVVLVVDHTSLVGGYDHRLHDRAVRGATSVARAYLAAGDRVGLVMFGSSVRWLPPGQGRVQQLRLLDLMVLRPLVASTVDPDLGRVPPRALPPRAIVFCFSSLLDERMVAAIARLVEHGHRLVVIDTVGPYPQRWPKGVSRRTREEWPRQRILVRSQLAELGALVIDDVGAIGPAVRGMSRRGMAG